MLIKDIQIKDIKVPLITPFKTALRVVSEVDDVAVIITTDCGKVGYGEAPPTAVITGDTKDSIKSAIMNFIKPAIINMDIENIDLCMFKLHNAIQKNTSAKAAVDMAIYDLYAQNLNKPLYKVLGGCKNQIETDITISLNEVDEMVKDSQIAVAKGFTSLKIKVGNDIVKDLQRIKEIRKNVGNDILIRVDANQGWKPKEAVRIITKMEDADLNIELVEQPVHYHDLEGMKYVTSRVYTNILADESVFTPEDAITIIKEKAADLINIKLMKTGGIYNALKICAIAEIYNVECMIGCMLESQVSVVAAAHLAAAKKIITRVDLDGPALCKESIVTGGPIFNNQIIQMTEDIGLGFKNVVLHN